MKYLLLICTTDMAELSEADSAALGPATDEWVRAATERGVRLLGHELAPAREARTVRVRAGQVTLTNGPFAEAVEQMAGFDLLECADLDEAIEVAAAHPMARYATVEVRPVLEDALPPE